MPDEIDPMVYRFSLLVSAAAMRMVTDEENQERFQLERQITERLRAAETRPSREDMRGWLTELLNHPNNQPTFERCLDLACGPEPKPRGKPIAFSVNPWWECQTNRCSSCSGVSIQLAGGRIALCPHDCHKEAPDA